MDCSHLPPKLWYGCESPTTSPEAGPRREGLLQGGRVTIRNSDDLADHIDSSLGWRRIELNALRQLIEQHRQPGLQSPTSRALCRSGVAMLYAHWEGFFKEACQAYVEQIARE